MCSHKTTLSTYQASQQWGRQDIEIQEHKISKPSWYYFWQHLCHTQARDWKKVCFSVVCPLQLQKQIKDMIFNKDLNLLEDYYTVTLMLGSHLSVINTKMKESQKNKTKKKNKQREQKNPAFIVGQSCSDLRYSSCTSLHAKSRWQHKHTSLDLCFCMKPSQSLSPPDTCCVCSTWHGNTHLAEGARCVVSHNQIWCPTTQLSSARVQELDSASCHSTKLPETLLLSLFQAMLLKTPTACWLFKHYTGQSHPTLNGGRSWYKMLLDKVIYVHT